MPFKMRTPLSVIGDRIEMKSESKLQYIVELFCFVGENCIIEARNGGDYTDRTGNLRSSIGYAVLRDGKVVQRNCVDKVKNGDEGVSKGDKFLSSCIKKAKRKKGITLIVTAGMNYAEYVEAKGYNVISSAELKSGTLIKRMLLQLGFTVK